MRIRSDPKHWTKSGSGIKKRPKSVSTSKSLVSKLFIFNTLNCEWSCFPLLRSFRVKSRKDADPSKSNL